jgi:hypothetical protein
VSSYAPGISLIFLPSGIKLVAALLGGFWGILGTILAHIYFVPQVWSDQPTWFYFVFPLLSGLSTYVAVKIVMHKLGIDDYLFKLQLLHIPVIDLFATLAHGFVINIFFFVIGLPLGPVDVTTRALAMAVGDFNGGFIVLMMLAGFLKLHELLTQD